MEFFAEYISPFLLAILQGATEFLPVSSSGHLILLNSLFGTDIGIVFDLVLHLATLVSVVLFYRREIVEICGGCFRELGSVRDSSVAKNNLHFVGCLLFATVITGTLGLLFNDLVESELRHAGVVGILLILNAVILWFSQKKGVLSLTSGALNVKTAAIIGLVQGLAVLPGISRSGSTITAALLLGVSPKDCAKISFLLSIPVILGAVILHIPDLVSMDGVCWPVLVGASVVAAGVGYGCLVLLDKVLKKANVHHFAPYCLVVGIFAVVFGFFM